MQSFYTCEPIVRTMGNNSQGLAQYQVTRITGMQDDTPLSGIQVYAGQAYCPDGHEDLDLMPLLRTMTEDQVRNLSTLHYWNQQDCSILQSTFAFNTYLSVTDASTMNSDSYSILYDTRGLTAYEAGVTNVTNVPIVNGYTANRFPERNIMEGQYFSLTWRAPSNSLETVPYTFGFEYVYTAQGPNPHDPSYIVLQRHQISTVTGQSFRFAGPVVWQSWAESNPARRGRFYLYHEKEGYNYITPWLYPVFCEDPETVYLYWLNSTGGIDFLRGRVTSTIEHEDSTYETGATIADYRDGWGNAVYHQRKWKTYSFGTKLISDNDSPNVADVCGARFAWLYFPDRVQPWKTVKVTDAAATVKSYQNQGGKLYNYTFSLEDSVKAKTV